MEFAECEENKRAGAGRTDGKRGVWRRRRMRDTWPGLRPRVKPGHTVYIPFTRAL
jgi:hypothetical protein